jgi:zinc/manganese transport system substrate-binding protein
MFDPRRAAAVARAIGARMAELDRSNAAAYREGTERFVRRLERARAGWERQLSGLRGAKVIAYHRSFSYLADWLGFTVVEHIEPRPGIPPNPHHVAHVLGAARQHRVRVILQEAFYPETTSELIAQRTGARLVRVPGGPDVRRGASYVDFVNDLVQMLARASR